MIEITPGLLREWGACWTDEEIAELYSLLGVESLTPLEVLDLDDVSTDDRLWVVLREEIIPARDLRIFGCDCATRALERERAAGREPDPMSLRAADVARRYAAGMATDEELAAARSSAWPASFGGSFWSASRFAALVVVWASEDAARVASWCAAGAAARAASRSDFREAELAWQLARVRELLDTSAALRGEE